MDASIPAGTEIARPFLPAKDFDLSKRFYEALGFAKVLDDEVAIFRIGASGFVPGGPTNGRLEISYQYVAPISRLRPGFPDDLTITFTAARS